MADDDAALAKEILHVAKAEMEHEIQPDSVSDDLRWKAVAAIRRSVGRGRDGDMHQVRLIADPRPALGRGRVAFERGTRRGQAGWLDGQGVTLRGIWRDYVT